MAKLTVAVDESKEAIGKGLLDAIAALSGSNDIDTFTVKMVNAAEKIGNAFRTVGDVIGLLNPNASVKVGGKFLRKSDMNAPRLSPATSRAILLKQEVTQIKTGVTLRKAENEQLKKKTAVDQLRDKFDLERIGLNTALNAAVDEETRLRIKSQIAILDNNEALAKKYLAEMNAAENAAKLAAAYETALASIKSLISRINTFILEQGGKQTTTTAGPTFSYALSTAQATNEKIAAFENKVAIESTRELNSRISEFLSQNNAQRSSSQAPMDIKVTVDAGGDRLSQAIAESIQVATRSGYTTVPNGFIA